MILHLALALQELENLFSGSAVDALERQEVRRILLTRPAVEAGEKRFLPGISKKSTLIYAHFMMRYSNVRL